MLSLCLPFDSGQGGDLASRPPHGLREPVAVDQPFRAVFIHWQDSVGPEGWTREVDGLAGLDTWAVGWLIREDKESVTLTVSYGGYAPREESAWTFLSPIKIPRRAIVSMADVVIPTPPPSSP